MITKKASSADRVKISETIYFALRTAKFLENKLGESFEYIEPIFENYTSYSLLSREIILQSCIQIEALANDFFDIFKNKDEKFSWKNFFIIVAGVDDTYLQNIRVNFVPLKKVPIYEYLGMCLIPWKLEDGKRFQGKKLIMPEWWNVDGGYNRIKHKGNKDISFCTYQKAVLSLSGLYAMIIFAKEYTGANANSDSSFVPDYFEGTRINSLFEKNFK